VYFWQQGPQNHTQTYTEEQTAAYKKITKKENIAKQIKKHSIKPLKP